MSAKVEVDDPAALLLKLSRVDFMVFLQRLWPVIHGGSPLLMNWHLKAIAYRLQQVEEGDVLRLLVNLPPRNGKSELISVFWVAWCLGQNPSKTFVCISYSNELSSKLARNCRDVMEHDLYRQIFPKTRIKRSRKAAYDFDTFGGGGRLATSISGTLTGRGGDVLIIDDAIKPDDVVSDTVRNAVNSWFGTTAVSRLNDKRTGAILVVQQRLHEYDLPGLLLEQGGWTHLSIPAIAVEDDVIPLIGQNFHTRHEGDLLHPEREPRFVFDRMRIDMGSAGFEAQYQQNPLPAEGNLYRAEWLEISPTEIGRGQIVQSWDTASKDGLQNDFSVCVTSLLIRDEIHIIHVFRKRLKFPKLVAKVNQLAKRYKANTVLIEDKDSGQQLIQDLNHKRAPGVPRPIKCRPSTDKKTRASGVSSIVESGRLFIPEKAPWLDEFKRELLSFPSGKFDDQVDALTQLLEWVRDRYRGQSRSKYKAEFLEFASFDVDDLWE